MSFVNLPLPNRALAVTPRPYALPRSLVLATLVFLVLAGFLIVWQGPGLWRDVQISQNPVTLRNGEVRDGECSTRRGITSCEARLIYSYNGASYDTHVEMAFVDFSSKDYEVWVVVSADKPELATLSLGLDMLWNRLIVFGIFMLIFLGGGIAVIVQAVRGMRGNSALRAPSRLAELVPVTVTAHKGQNFSYRGAGPARADKRTAHARLDKGQEPLFAVDADGQVVAVAARFENSALPVLLDSELERLDLSDAERRTALEAFHGEQGQRGAEAAALHADKPAKSGFNIWRRLGLVLAVVVLAVVALLGYWLYYVTSSTDRFDSLGMELNNMMPEPLNAWGCGQLKARFGNERAPYGCVASDFVSWK